MKVKFIYNPASGEAAIISHIDYIISAYQKRGITIVPYRLSRDQAISRAFEDIDDTFLHILIAGGDGTVNSVVNAMIQSDVDLPIAVLPCGTANDFAGMLGMPSSIQSACRRVLAGDVSEIDLGKANDRYFLNLFCSGLFTEVSHKTPTTLKNTFGKLAYYFSSLGELPNFKKLSLKIESKELYFEGQCLIFFVFNGRTAGNFKFATASDVDDGLLDVLIVKGDNIGETIKAIFHFLSRRTTKYPAGIVHFKTDRLRITSPDRIITDVDGEPGPLLPVEITCLNRKLRVIIPKSRH